jgi:hypothetical protein
MKILMRKIGEVSREVLLGTGRVGTRILHDYLFNELEKKLETAIKHVSGESISSIKEGTLIKVTGTVEIDDIERMLQIMEKYNDLYAHMLIVGKANELQNQIWDLEDKLKTVSKHEAKKLEEELKTLTPEGQYRSQRKGISQILIDSIKKFYHLLYENIFEIKIVCPFDENIVFRGIINKDYLREKPELLYAKYGTRTQVNWTLVGHVTTTYNPAYIGEAIDITLQNEKDIDAQATENKEPSQSLENSEEVTISESNSSELKEVRNNLRDVFENLYTSLRGIEEHLVQPAERKTFVVTPLAIFQEISL